MISENDLEYIKSLILVYKKYDYDYYLVHSVSNNDSYNIIVYFSKEKIEAVTDSYFEVRNGIEIYLNTMELSSLDNFLSSSYNGYVSIDDFETIYTNADLIENYSIETLGINADIVQTTNYSDVNVVLVVIICLFFVYFFIRDLFKLR